MNPEWLVAAPAFAVVALYAIVPGTLVRLAGWHPRSLTPYLLAPAISVGIISVAANLAPLLGLDWGPAPVALVTAVAAVAAWALRRWAGSEGARPASRLAMFAAVGGAALAAIVMITQLTSVFVAPGNISQTFDNIVHLNAIGLALDNANASAAQIGATSQISFYPNAWHSLVTLAADATGVPVPVAVNATNIMVGAIVWPVSCMALASAFFRERPAALVGSAALSTAFGAFPILLMSFGVLYPNMMGYATLPAGLAALWLLLHARDAAQTTRAVVTLLVVCAAIGLGHPNAFLALFAMGGPLAAAALLRRAVVDRTRDSWIRFGATTLGVLVVGAGLWKFARTDVSMAGWAPWTGTGEALLQGFLLSPRSMPVTFVAAALIVIGVIAAIAKPARLVFLVPFAVALLLFVVVSGTPYSVWRDALTNPWYNDSHRLAALLPIAGVPVATMGVIAAVDAAQWATRRLTLPHWILGTLATIAAISLFTLGAGPNATSNVTSARDTYESTATSPLLTAEEQSLLDRLDESVPADAAILGNPWTGTSLALALADRHVVERHIFGERSEDELYLDQHLREIDSDPEVCDALGRVGVDFVLDFGSQNVFNDPGQGLERQGLNDLTPSTHLELVDAEGPNARLFRVVGC